MAVGFEILVSSRNRITLGKKSEQFLHLKFDSRYLKSNALNLAILAFAAYQDRDTVEEFLFKKNKPGSRDFGFPGSGNAESGFLFDCLESAEQIHATFDFIDEPSTDTQYFHYRTKDYLLIAMRGTASAADGLTDANAQMVHYPEAHGMVHKGFHVAFKSIMSSLDGAVSDAPSRKVVLCGHSLGGALAVMAAAYIRKKFKREVMIYTYGCPSVGNTDFTHQYTKTEPIIYWRVVNNQDIVPMVPPPGSRLRLNILALAAANPLFLIPATIDPFGKPFHQMGKLVFIRRVDHQTHSVDVDKKTPAYIRIPNTIPIKELIEERPKWEKLLNWLGASASDHSMATYVSILATDLKHAIEAYLYADQVTAENAKKITAYLEAEIAALRKTRANLEKKMLMPSGGTAYPDATSASPTPPDKLTPAEKFHLLDEALQAKQMELTLQRGFIASAKSPAYKETLLKGIVDLKMSPNLKKELEYQAKHIRF